MKKLTIFVMSTIISSFALADFEIPNQFEDGQVTSASQMNENFQALKFEIESLKAQLGSNQGAQTIQFQGYSAPVSGSAGVAEYAVACDSVSPGSRMCSDSDLIERVFEYPEYRAWIKRTLSEFGNCLINDQPYYLSSSGRFTRINSYPSGCNSSNMLPIACCK